MSPIRWGPKNDRHRFANTSGANFGPDVEETFTPIAGQNRDDRVVAGAKRSLTARFAADRGYLLR